MLGYKGREYPEDYYWEETNEKDKYFIPDINDISLSYEMEFYNLGAWKGERWSIFKLRDEMINPWTGKESNIFSVLKGNIDKGFIRIPYLTKEQIESEGWFVTKEENFLRGTHPIEVDVKLTYSKSDKWLWLQIPGTIITEDLNKIPYDAGMYVGFCPSINEFRKICKLLGL